MNKAARTLAAGVAVAALALTGCANSPADAATVNGVRIADSTVREVARVLGQATGSETGLALKQATYDLVLGEAARQIAASTGTTITAADQQEVIGQYPAVAATTTTTRRPTTTRTQIRRFPRMARGYSFPRWVAFVELVETSAAVVSTSSTSGGRQAQTSGGRQARSTGWVSPAAA